MKQDWLLLLAVLVNVVDVVALGVLHVDLDSGKGAGLVQVVHEVELELQHEVEEPLVPHLNQDGLLDDVHQALDERLVLGVEVLGEPDGDLVVAQVDANLLRGRICWPRTAS